MSETFIPDRSGVSLEAKVMGTTIEEIVRDRASEIASVKDDAGRTTTVFRGEDVQYRHAPGGTFVVHPRVVQNSFRALGLAAPRLERG